MLSFGGVDNSKFEGELKWYPVTYKHFYGIRLDDIKFDGKSSGLCPAK